ncbi:hypothetical protein XELAEV_18000546mg [Xenopus laevis]|nr:hypothetical protein XELAEV_18000546mg [Xenopus laevis]
MCVTVTQRKKPLYGSYLQDPSGHSCEYVTCCYLLSAQSYSWFYCRYSFLSPASVLHFLRLWMPLITGSEGQTRVRGTSSGNRTTSKIVRTASRQRVTYLRL